MGGEGPDQDNPPLSCVPMNNMSVGLGWLQGHADRPQCLSRAPSYKDNTINSLMEAVVVL